MTIQTVPSLPRRLRYSASTGQVAFPFNFPVFLPSDLDVRRFRAGAETLLEPGGDYSVTGAGAQGGGTVTLRVPAEAGDLIVIRSAQAYDRSAIFRDGGPLLAGSMLAEWNRHTIGQQQLDQRLEQTLRLPASDPTDLAELPGPLARANGVLAFGAAGELLLIPRASIGGGIFQQAGEGAVPRTVQDELALRVHPRQFGGAGDGTQDDTLAVQRAANLAGALGAMLDLDDATWLTSNTVQVPAAAAGVRQRGTIRYAGPPGRAALVIGEGGGVRCQAKEYRGLSVVRATLSTWLDEADIGICLRNIDACEVSIARVEGFTVGVQLRGEAVGCEDSTLYLGRLVNNRFGLDLTCTQASSWNNSIRYMGGHFANASSVHPTLSRYGVRLSNAPGAYDRHNAHAFYGAAFELQRQGNPGTVEAIPFLIESTDVRGVRGHDLRMEGCSRFVAKVTGQASDCAFSVSYTGTYGWVGNQVLYATGSTRNGVSVEARHLAEAAHSSPRLFAEAANVRALAFRDNSISSSGQGYTGAVGFEGMAVLSGNPSGAPTAMSALMFPALTLITLGNDGVTIPTARAVVFVVDVRECKEIVLAAEGYKLRPIVQQFDQAETLLGQDSPVTFSSANCVWSPGDDGQGHPVEGLGTSRWWEMNVNLDEPLTINLAGSPVDTVQGINKHQRIRLHENAAYAAIGVRGGQADAVLRSLRLYCSPVQAPPLLYGGNRGWGQRERSVIVAYDPPSLASGARAGVEVAFPGVRYGDIVAAGFTPSTGTSDSYEGIRVSANVKNANKVQVWLENLGASTFDPAAGTLYVSCAKPRL